MFCEYMMLKSHGQLKSNQWWREEYQNFVTFFKKIDGGVYEIDDLTQILWSELEDIIEHYFSFLNANKNRRKYHIEDDKCTSFILLVKLKYGLLSTNFLISGLLTTYKDDWSIFVSRYISSVNNEKQEQKTVIILVF